MPHNYENRKYSVVPYDPNWVKLFEAEAARLKQIFGHENISIEHIGSTAFPGMSGKPAIDILVLVDDVDMVNAYIRKIEALGIPTRANM